VNYIREFEIAAGVPRQSVYDVTLYILAGFLVVGFLCNWAVKPLAQKWFMSDEQVAALQTAAPPHAHAQSPKSELQKAEASASVPLAWLAVGIPIAWGIWVTLQSALVLF
jgi:hypothetical protein